MAPRNLSDIFHQQDITSTWTITSIDYAIRYGFIDRAKDATGSWYWRRCDERGLPLDTAIHGPYATATAAIHAATLMLEKEHNS